MFTMELGTLFLGTTRHSGKAVFLVVGIDCVISYCYNTNTRYKVLAILSSAVFPYFLNFHPNIPPYRGNKRHLYSSSSSLCSTARLFLLTKSP
jgi:hypothetical protein